jgi:hypothetical protein
VVNAEEVLKKVAPVSTAMTTILARAGNTQRKASGDGFQGPRFV